MQHKWIAGSHFASVIKYDTNLTSRLSRLSTKELQDNDTQNIS